MSHDRQPMKLVIYCRTSTSEQKSNGSGIKTQEVEARAWAQREAHTIHGTRAIASVICFFA